MADAKNKQTSKDDAGQAEVQARSDEAEEKGYLGEVPPGPPNEAFSLESGPDSPSVSEQLAYRADDA
ncbi:hypothetical protein BH24ACT15_BH24ACT15_37560 [soil metagenome]